MNAIGLASSGRLQHPGRVLGLRRHVGEEHHRLAALVTAEQTDQRDQAVVNVELVVVQLVLFLPQRVVVVHAFQRRRDRLRIAGKGLFDAKPVGDCGQHQLVAGGVVVPHQFGDQIDHLGPTGLPQVVVVDDEGEAAPGTLPLGRRRLAPVAESDRPGLGGCPLGAVQIDGGDAGCGYEIKVELEVLHPQAGHDPLLGVEDQGIENDVADFDFLDEIGFPAVPSVQPAPGRPLPLPATRRGTATRPSALTFCS